MPAPGEHKTVKGAAAGIRHTVSGQLIPISEKPSRKSTALLIPSTLSWFTLPREANIFASEYRLYLPSKEDLRQRLLEWTQSDAGTEAADES